MGQIYKLFLKMMISEVVFIHLLIKIEKNE